MFAKGQTACEPSQSPPTATRFHLSLNVANLERSIGFFRAFLGCEPAKCRTDYAKFELDDPPLVLSLEPSVGSAGGNLNHLGFRVSDSSVLVEVQRRLELAGIPTLREEGVECCYARQTKFWLHDPDGNLWEIYTIEEDLDHRGDGQLPVLGSANVASGNESAAAVWVHRLGDKFPQRLPILDQTVDRVVLEGTFNERLTRDEQLRRLAEVRRVMKAEGVVHLHMLTADRPTGDGPVRLPGPAAAVEAVPQIEEVCEALTDSGFTDAKAVFHAQSPCFRWGECELRETRLEARASGS